MKSILVVVENEVYARSMLEKSMTFSPESIHLAFFGKGDTANTQATLDEVTDKRCKVEMITNVDSSSYSLSATLSQIVKQINPDMVVFHRPQVGSGKQEYSMVKAVLRNAAHTVVLLSGHNKWKSKMKIVATLDMIDESSSQQLLNTKVLDVALELIRRTQAKLTLLSIVEISRFRDELDIIVPTDLMSTKGEAIKLKLNELLKDKGEAIDVSTYVSIGVPAKEISFVSRKLKADFVIMGNVGRTGIKGLIVGNTVEKIINRLAVDTLIVKT